MATLALAICWTVFIFWPYLRLTRRVMVESLRLAEASNRLLAGIESDILSTLTETRAAVAEVRKAVADVKADPDLKRAIAALEAVPAKLDALAQAGTRRALERL